MSLTFNDYQQQALSTSVIDHDPLMAKTICAMGIAGEAGEVIEKWKKIVVYKQGKIASKDLDELAKELGDVVWYIAVFAEQLGLSFEDIMERNLAKLKDRANRNVIKGVGDSR